MIFMAAKREKNNRITRRRPPEGVSRHRIQPVCSFTHAPM